MSGKWSALAVPAPRRQGRITLSIQNCASAESVAESATRTTDFDRRLTTFCGDNRDRSMSVRPPTGDPNAAAGRKDGNNNENWRQKTGHDSAHAIHSTFVSVMQGSTLPFSGAPFCGWTGSSRQKVARKGKRLTFCGRPGRLTKSRGSPQRQPEKNSSSQLALNAMSNPIHPPTQTPMAATPRTHSSSPGPVDSLMR